jgi:hypothetical protein
VNEEPRAWSGRAFALVLLAVCAAGVLAVALWSRGGEESASQAEPAAGQDGIAATADFSPRIVLFGDTLVAHVDAVVDPTRVDPETVKVAWNATPWAPVSAPRTTVERAGSAAHVQSTYVLRCLSAVCAPARETERVDLEPARVTYGSAAGGAPGRQSIEVTWPTLVVHTRVGDLDPASRDALAAPWRADLAALPAVSYRIPPRLAVAILVTLGALLLALAGVVVYRAWPRRQPEPEPEPEPEPVASVLEQALELLEAEVSADGVEERRRALELVADEVEHLGDDELAGSARELAWSPVDPEPARTRALAADLRVRFAGILAELEAERSNGVPAGRKNGGHP